MITLLALRNLAHRPLRSLFLLFGYSLGVGVMIVLLAIGQAMLAQARDEKLVGGGQVTVLPEGMDIEVMKTGGVGGLFFSIANARFIYRELLASPRSSHNVATVAPQIDGKLLYLRAHGSRAHGARGWRDPVAQRLRSTRSRRSIAGAWRDDDGDRRWATPTPHELYTSIDHFHMPPAHVAHPESWAEWHYFNVLSPSGKEWAFISFIVGRRCARHEVGRAGRGERARAGRPHAPLHVERAEGAGPLLHRQRRPRDRHVERASAPRRHATPFAPSRARTARARRSRSISPSLRRRTSSFPARRSPSARTRTRAARSRPGTRCRRCARMRSGSMCIAAQCEHYDDAQSYHDHNWGVWHGVTLGLGRDARGLVHAALRPRRAAGQRRHDATLLRLSHGLARLSRALPPARDRVRGWPHDPGERTRRPRADARACCRMRAAPTRSASISTSRTRSAATRARRSSSAAMRRTRGGSSSRTSFR